LNQEFNENLTDCIIQSVFVYIKYCEKLEFL
jgi:hypothetical protein